MPRIEPLPVSQISTDIQMAFDQHVSAYRSKITNMKATLAHSLLAFDVYMQWYPLYEKVKSITGDRMASLFAYAISYASDCPLCSTFFRKIIIDSGEKPEAPVLHDREQKLVAFGATVAKQQGNIPDILYQEVSEHFSDEEMVVLIAFAGQMIATNIFNNVVETEIDNYLAPYLPNK